MKLLFLVLEELYSMEIFHGKVHLITYLIVLEELYSMEI